MARVHLLLCFTLLFASVTILDVVSAHLRYKPALPQIEDPQTVDDVEGYTVNVVMVFVSDLEKECPKTSKFKLFFEKLRAYAKYVCPIKRLGQRDYDLDMKAKAGGLLKAISSFAIGKIREEIQEEKMEAIQTFKWMKSVALRILGGRKKDEGEANMKLTAEQQKEIKEGILKWQTVITRITNTMVQSTTTESSSTTETSTSEKESSGSKGSSKDTTGSNSNSGSPSGETPSSTPSGSNSPVESGTKTSSKDTSSGKSTVSSGSSTNSPSEDSKTKSTPSEDSKTKSTPSEDSKTKSTPSEDSKTQSGDSKKSTTSESVVSASESKEITVTEVETQTSEQVMAFIMNLEKKCPQKEEYKLFFENLKGTFTIGSSKASSPKRKGLFSRIRSAAGKLSEAISFMRSRIGAKSAEVKKSMENYQAQVMKTVQELDAIHSQIVSSQQSKNGGALTCSPAQQAEIKQTIVRWEQVTTQFVEVAIQSESSSSSSSSSSSTHDVQAN